MSLAQRAPAPAGATPVPRQRASLATRLAGGTPERLRLLAAVTAVIGLVFGVVALQTFRATASALERADAGTAQLLRVQQIEIGLARADATATNAFLVTGGEPAGQREQYVAALDEATGLVARAATAQPADADALARLNTVVVTYAGTIEQARANNRQNLQVGAQYLRTASASLRADALPLLDALATANRGRVDAELQAVADNRQALYGTGTVAVVVLVGGSVWLALRTRRYLNTGLVVAFVLVLVPLLGGGNALSGVGEDAEDTRTGALQETISLAGARADAFDARSNESLTLVSRGSGAAFEEAWTEASTRVVEALEPDLDELWQAYADEHAAVRELDDGGDWDGAVAAATAADGALATTFAAFDGAVAGDLQTSSAQATSELTASVGWLPWVGWLALLAGIGAAVAAWRGVGERLEEYR